MSNLGVMPEITENINYSKNLPQYSFDDGDYLYDSCKNTQVMKKARLMNLNINSPYETYEKMNEILENCGHK